MLYAKERAPLYELRTPCGKLRQVCVTCGRALGKNKKYRVTPKNEAWAEVHGIYCRPCLRERKAKIAAEKEWRVRRASYFENSRKKRSA